MSRSKLLKFAPDPQDIANTERRQSVQELRASRRAREWKVDFDPLDQKYHRGLQGM